MHPDPTGKTPKFPWMSWSSSIAHPASMGSCEAPGHSHPPKRGSEGGRRLLAVLSSTEP